MLVIPCQPGLELLAYGVSGHVYQVSDSVVLKSPLIYEPPAERATDVDRSNYKLDLVQYFADIEHERQIFRKLPHHGNVVRPIATHYPEGIYMQRLCPLQSRIKSDARPALPTRVLWYQDMVSALIHIHGSGMAHTMSDYQISSSMHVTMS